MSFDGFAFNVPSATNYDMIYNKYFTNLAHVSMLVNHAVIELVDQTNDIDCQSSKINDSEEEKVKINGSDEENFTCQSCVSTTNQYATQIFGTLEAQHHVKTSILVPLELSQYKDVNSMCEWSHEQQISFMKEWINSLHIPRKVITQHPHRTLAVVILTRNKNVTDNTSTLDTNIAKGDFDRNEEVFKVETQTSGILSKLKYNYEPIVEEIKEEESEITYDVDCLLDIVDSYNNYVKSSFNSTENSKMSQNELVLSINAIILNTDNTDINTNSNNTIITNNGEEKKYRSIQRKRTLHVNDWPNEMHRQVSVNVLVYECERTNVNKANEWENVKRQQYMMKEERALTLEEEKHKIVTSALFNTRRWASDYVFPFYVVQIRNNEDLLVNSVATNDNNTHKYLNSYLPQEEQESKEQYEEQSIRKPENNTVSDWLVGNTTCLTQSTTMQDRKYSCAPLGGWTHWASTANTSWEYNSVTNKFDKHTPENSIALLISITEWSLAPNVAPGADGTASAIAAALVIAEAIKRHNAHFPHETVSLYLFGLPSEYYGHVGSARIIYDAQHFHCSSNNNNNNSNNNNINICTGTTYKDYLNFTTIDFTKFSTIVSLDQLSYSNFAPLYIHVDDRVMNTPTNGNKADEFERNVAMERVLAWLQHSYNITRADTPYLSFSPVTTYIDLAPEQIENKIIFTLTRYNTQYVNPFVFTPSDAVDEATVATKAINAIAEAAQVIVDVIIHTSRINHMSNNNSNKNINNNLNSNNDNNNKKFNITTNNAIEQTVKNESTTIDHDLLRHLWHCLTVNVHCEYLESSVVHFPECAKVSSVPDYSTHTFTLKPRQSSAECVIAAALHKLNYNVLASPALSPLLNFSVIVSAMESESSPWHLITDYMYISRLPKSYQRVHVVSTWPENGIAARVATMASSSVQVMTFIVGLLVIIGIAFIMRRCTYAHCKCTNGHNVDNNNDN